MPRDGVEMSELHATSNVPSFEGDQEDHAVNYGPCCPVCGGGTQRRVQCKLYCSGCNTLLENCNGD